MTPPRVVTIGVYGWREAEFFTALQNARVDLFCDIRRRRAVRGGDYAFANSQRLQTKLAEMGIAYRHLLELAPSDAVRQTQEQADKTARIPRRQRTKLDPGYVQAYRHTVLKDFSPEQFLAALPDDVKTIALFCVEAVPQACHRSLVAETLAALGADVQHLVWPE